MAEAGSGGLADQSESVAGLRLKSCIGVTVIITGSRQSYSVHCCTSIPSTTLHIIMPPEERILPSFGIVAELYSS